MYCWSCGESLSRFGGPCPRCNAPPALPEREPRGRPLGTCPACGYRGDGIPYFRRAGHAALLVAATVFTYGIGGLAYWLLKRNDLICPSCGLSWGRAVPAFLPGKESLGPESGTSLARGGGDPGRSGTGSSGFPGEALPGSGIGRRVTGVVLALVALLLLGTGIVEAEASMVAASAAFGAGGAASFAWGWKALQQRREAVLRRLQRRVLNLARERGGRLTATDVASELDLSLSGGERVLLSLDDGFRVRSDVTDEGLLVFDFPEIRLRPGSPDEPAVSGNTPHGEDSTSV
jgi:hypothetical protein